MNIYPTTQLLGNVSIDAGILDRVRQQNWYPPSEFGNPLYASDNLYLPRGIAGGRLTEHDTVSELAVVLDPVLDQIQSLMPSCKCVRAMVVRLPAGVCQDWHVDPRVLHKLSHRLHVALITNSESVLEVQDHQQHFAVGEVWEFNNMLPHRAKNSGECSRIHFITDWIDCQQFDESKNSLHNIRQDVIDNVGVLYDSTRGTCLSQDPYTEDIM